MTGCPLAVPRSAQRGHRDPASDAAALAALSYRPLELGTIRLLRAFEVWGLRFGARV